MKWTLGTNPYRGEVSNMTQLDTELKRQDGCKHTYCLRCKHIQDRTPGRDFVCAECGWTVGEAIP